MKVRLPVDATVLQRAAAIGKDSLLTNTFVDTSANETKYVTKRPGFLLGVGGVTNGTNYGVYINPNTGSFYYIGGNGVPIIGSPPNYWNPSNSYTIGQSVIYRDNTTPSKGNRIYTAINNNTNSIPSSTNSDWSSASLWTLVSSAFNPVVNFGILGCWYIGNTFYLCVATNALMTDYAIYANSGTLETSANYLLVASGTIPTNNNTSPQIPITELNLITVTNLNSSGIWIDPLFDSGVSNVYTSSNGVTFTSPLFDTGINSGGGRSGYTTTSFLSNLYTWISGVGGGLYKYTDSTSATFISTTGLSINTNSRVALATVGSNMFAIECLNSGTQIKIYSSINGSSWNLISTNTTTNTAFIYALVVNGSKVYLLTSSNTNSYSEVVFSSGLDLAVSSDVILSGPANLGHFYLGVTTVPYAVAVVITGLYIHKRSSL